MLRPRPRVLALALPLCLFAGACTGTPPDQSEAANPPAEDDDAKPEAPATEAEAPAAAEAEAPVEPEVEAPPPDPWGPISPEQRATMMAGEEEERIKTEIHYVKTNERRHDVWFPYIADKRGVYVGVAADQNYTLIGVARSEFVFLMDLDWRVTELHRAYEILIEASDTPEALHQRFHEDNEEASVEVISGALTAQGVDEGQQRQILMSWRGARETVYRHLAKVITRTEAGQPTSWLSNPDYYDHIRTLYQNDRVRMLVGDLTGPKTLQTIAKAAEGLGTTVNVLYLSNAEEYYDYTSQYRANIKALPIVADRSVVLRTIYSKNWVHADSLWNYQVQPLADYQARMDDPKAGRRNRMLTITEKEGVLERNAEGVDGLSRINITLLADHGGGGAAQGEADQ